MVKARHFLAICVTLVICFGVAGCSAWKDIRFTQDKSIAIVEPKNLSTQPLPVRVAWTVEPGSDAEKLVANGAKFAVFLDRYPMAPKENVRDVINNVEGCRANDACLRPEALFTQFGLTITSESSITLSYFPWPQQGDTRFVTIVLVDDNGTRIGDSVWYTGFREGKK